MAAVKGCSELEAGKMLAEAAGGGMTTVLVLAATVEIIEPSAIEDKTVKYMMNGFNAKEANMNRKLDTDQQVFFYEQEFYVLSNFSAFCLYWAGGMRFDTSEAAYHYEKFPGHDDIQSQIINATSAHDAFKIAERNKIYRRADWDDVKVDIMRDILRAKAAQHEYVRRKLLATGDRELVEDSWRDDFWGCGPNRDGANMLGRLWMEVRAEQKAAKS